MTVCRLFFEDFPKRESHSFYSGFIRDLGVIRSWFLRRFFASSSRVLREITQISARFSEELPKEYGRNQEAAPKQARTPVLKNKKKIIFAKRIFLNAI